ncbi:MAG TPA: hypothetical protein VGI06_03355, partial [Acidimicrobiales bacterium]
MSPSQAGVRVVGSGAPAEDDDDVPPPPVDEDEDSGGGGGRRPPVLVIVLVVLVILGLAGTAFYWSKYRTLSNKGHTQGQVVAVSRDFLLALTNFQAGTIDADFNRVQSYATGDFQSQALSFFSSDVRQALAKVQAVSRGQISALYVQSIQGDQATTYADVDQTIANINFKTPEQDELRIV